MHAKYSFDGIINNNVNEIVNTIREISTKNKDNYVKLKEVVIESDFSHKYELMDVPNELFVDNTIMCLIYSSIDPFLVNSPIMKQYQDKVVELCKILSLNPRNVVPVSSIEEQLHSVLI